MGAASSFLPHLNQDEEGSRHSIAAGLINASLPMIGVAVVSQTSMGDSHPAIDDLRAARRGSVAAGSGNV